MRNGTVDATICICAKPLGILSQLDATSGFKLLEVPFVEGFRNTYLPSLTSDDYGKLLPKGSKVETIATTMVLVSFNWPLKAHRATNERQSSSTHYSRSFRNYSGRLAIRAGDPSDRRHSPGVQDFKTVVAQDWLDRNMQQSASLRASFMKVMPDQVGAKAGAPASVDSEKLFRDFMDFMRKEPN